MPRAKVNQIEIEYEILGDSKDPTILLIMGLGSQLTRWPAEFCEMIVARGFQVIRFDNRDVGLSTHFHGVETPSMMDVFSEFLEGKKPSVPYTVSDMASDTIGVLDAARIEKAHIVGVSMGGIIGQHVAATYPERVFSFTSIMASTGNPELPQPTPEAFAFLAGPIPDAKADQSAYIEYQVNGQQILGSPGYRQDASKVRERILADFKRSHNPKGVARQVAAVIADGDRRELLNTIKVPVVVIHGEDDPLVPLAAGKDTAENIPNAELRTIPGMGHNLPEGLYPTVVDAIMRAVERSGK